MRADAPLLPSGALESRVSGRTPPLLLGSSRTSHTYVRISMYMYAYVRTYTRSDMRTDAPLLPSGALESRVSGRTPPLLLGSSRTSDTPSRAARTAPSACACVCVRVCKHTCVCA
jgi:hypothetical protein